MTLRDWGLMAPFAFIAAALPLFSLASTLLPRFSVFFGGEKMKTFLWIALATLTNSFSAHADTGSHYDWGRGYDGWGYCYEYTNYGVVLNGGAAVGNYLCEATKPSSFDWGRGQNGWGYCYQYTPYGVPMNQGSAQPNSYCEMNSRSYYSWGQGIDGYTYCYQYTAKGVAMNDGQPLANYYCQ
jgi:hypothetical protein